jgi:hypothetical protein
VPGKDFERDSVVEFSRSGQEKQNKAASGKKNWNIKNDIHRHPD